jgi:hydrogenase small subunit
MDLKSDGSNPGFSALAAGEKVSDLLERRGVSRRDFMKFCSAMAASLALPPAFGAKIAHALDEVKKPTLVWLEFQSCTGDTEALLRAGSPTIAELVLLFVYIVFGY